MGWSGCLPSPWDLLSRARGIGVLPRGSIGKPKVFGTKGFSAAVLDTAKPCRPCVGNGIAFESMVVSMMEFASPTHISVMTTGEYLEARAAELQK